MGDFSRLTTCPLCGKRVVIHTDEWLGDSVAKAKVEAVKELARQNCEKCKEVDNDNKR
jgi:hypothetical protein